jgi:hypothetical protein
MGEDMANRPHIVYRQRTEKCAREHWTGSGWDRDSTAAKPLPFGAAITVIITQREDPAQREFGFGMYPAE